MAVTSPDEQPQPAPSPQPQQPFHAPPPPPGYGPPYAAQPYPVPPPQRPTKPPMSTGKVVAIVLACVFGGSLLLCGGLFAIGLAKSSSGSGTNASDRDVRMVECGGAGSIAGASAEVEVTNTSKRTRSYVVTVSFTDSSGSTQYATGTAFINDVAPGQSGRGTATSWKADSGISTCKVTKVRQSAF